MLQRLYDWTMSIARHRNALLGLALVSFLESSVFPIPPDALIIPIVLAAREKAWRVFVVATAASVAGGWLGYAIGFFLFETIGEAVLSFYGYMDRFADWRAAYNEWGAWIVAAGGLTPIPYKVITIASGVMQTDLGVFTVASVASRGLRFGLECLLLWYFGPPIKRFVEGNLPLLATLGFVLLLGGFIALKFL
ncbi:MAG: YqaA family protein [Rhodovibrionaceae bacterium]|nr:YqaA family protein [Rhodovibrionaceae bacterium]